MCNDGKSKERYLQRKGKVFTRKEKVFTKEKKSIYKERKSTSKGKEKYLQGFRCKTALQESTLATTSPRPFPPSIIVLFFSFLFFDHYLLS